MNPWTVVNTAKRYPVRLLLLRSFESQLKRFAKDLNRPRSMMERLQTKLKCSLPYLKDDAIFHFVVEDKVDGQIMSLGALIQVFLLTLLFFFYFFTTWNVEIRRAVDDE